MFVRSLLRETSNHMLPSVQDRLHSHDPHLCVNVSRQMQPVQNSREKGPARTNKEQNHFIFLSWLEGFNGAVLYALVGDDATSSDAHESPS